MTIIKEEQGIALIRIDDDYHVVRIDRDSGQVYSTLPSDMPAYGGSWFAGISTFGVRYVSNPRTRSGGLSGFRRAVARVRETETGW